MVTDEAKKVIRDKVAAEIKTATAKLLALKAEAEAVKAGLEIKAIAELITKHNEILHKLHPSEKS